MIETKEKDQRILFKNGINQILDELIEEINAIKENIKDPEKINSDLILDAVCSMESSCYEITHMAERKEFYFKPEE